MSYLSEDTRDRLGADEVGPRGRTTNIVDDTPTISSAVALLGEELRTLGDSINRLREDCKSILRPTPHDNLTTVATPTENYAPLLDEISQCISMVHARQHEIRDMSERLHL